MELLALAEAVREQLGSLGAGLCTEDNSLVLDCRPPELRRILYALREGEVSFEYFSFIAGVDYLPTPPAAEGQEGAPGRVDLVYHVVSVSHDAKVFVRTSVSRPGPGPGPPPRVPSVADIYPGANWHERECYDLFGIEFDGHPDLRRILMPEDWVGHPLLKDYDNAVNDLEYVPEKKWPEVASKR